ncbi:hypothetical protein HZF05_17845 [Sphingomonas sp. CGMCC 1.13654]|uniref:Cell envelope biogenesis protein TolA n=1 Tax=Sphingomonas chungangi TaxID=2683589 RepID=A0A838LCS8_9SPHN|nr:hypothetical protein [Sphingomonas chungangi]MBA2935946.1 hypothetical protein [Sphingomonas chungangi]MVW54636.1 hypothetical protein [Sphingomonas chungangi]
MVRKQKLKVYRTTIGFHDAYVAAPSQKAALKAWGVDVDLFARGVAEAVDDEKLSEAPLKDPGTVVRVPRGSSEEHMAALPKAKPARRKAAPTPDDEGPPPRRSAKSEPKTPARRTFGRNEEAPEPRNEEPAPKPKARSKPRPSRARLENAEKALERSEAEHREAIDRIREQEKALQTSRRDLESRHEAEFAKLEARIAKARAGYGAALEKWRG